MLFKSLKALATAALIAMAVPGAARAADLPPVPDSNQWRFTIAPYVWGVGLSGDVGLFGLRPSEIDIPFSDIIQNLDFAAMGVAEAHNGTWGVMADINYTSLSASKSETFYRDRPVFNFDGKIDASIDVTEFIATIMAEWRAVDTDQLSLDLMAGARYWNVQNDLTVKATLTVTGPIDRTLSKKLSGDDGASWVDPMIGVRARINTGTPAYFTGWALGGGAGVGSDYSWDLMGGVGYEWTEHFSTVLAYRALGVDYDNDGFVYDVVQQGAALGLVFNF